MWNNEDIWFFEEGTPEGFNVGGIAEFASTKYDGLAREIIQNSIDAVNNECDPVRVEFERITLPIDLFPNIDGLINSVNECISFMEEDIGNKSIDKLKSIRNYLNHIKSDGKFNVLKISDYNTKGLSGSDKTFHTPWANLVRITGNSNKKEGSQGSFGIGKYAPFVFSNIRTILYSTKDIEGNIAVQGKSILSGHISNGNTRTPNGYFGKMYKKNIQDVLHDDSAPIFDIDNIPEVFTRKEVGTSLYILCSKTPTEWVDQVLMSVINSFLYAINNNNLEVSIIDESISKNVLINSNNINEHISYALDNLNTNNVNLSKETFKGLKISNDMYKLLCNIDKAKISEREFDLPNNKVGKMKLLLYTAKDLDSKQIIHIRKAGMKIEEASHRSILNYIGICITSNDEMNEFLTSCEAPKHDSWNSNNCGDEESQRYARTILNKIDEWERQEIGKLCPISENERIDPLGMEEFLPSDNIGEENGLKTNTESINFKPLNTSIKKKRNSQQTIVQLSVNDAITPEEGGTEYIEGPSGTNEGGNGTGTGNGGNETPGSSGNGNRKTREKITIENVKTPYMNELGKYIVSFIPQKTCENCELSIRLAGDDSFENIEIEKLYIIKNNGCEEVSTFPIKENEKIIFEVHLKNVERSVLEVNCYAKK